MAQLDGETAQSETKGAEKEDGDQESAAEPIEITPRISINSLVFHFRNRNYFLSILTHVFGLLIKHLINSRKDH